MRHLEDVVSHLRGRDSSLRWMDTSHDVPLKDSANRRGENLAITITVSMDVVPPAILQTAIVVDVGGFGNEDSLAGCKQ